MKKGFKDFDLQSEFKPAGDQPGAIKDIVEKFNKGKKEVTLLGATGTGKTFTVANVIKQMGKNTLILAHNKTLAGQLYFELKQLFPNDNVEYFISNFDFYQPEAYKPSTGTYVEKSSKMNKDIEMMRLSAMSSLLTEKNTIVVSSVACIYSLSNPELYKGFFMMLEVGQDMKRKDFINYLVKRGYTRKNVSMLDPGEFSVKGDVIEIGAAWQAETVLRIDLAFDEVNSITYVDPKNKTTIDRFQKYPIYPAKETLIPDESYDKAIKEIEKELVTRVQYFEKQEKYAERQRIEERVNFDIEQLKEYRTCNGIENYAAVIEGRLPGERPWTIIDYFKDDFLMVIDESHITLPQTRAMYHGDRSRKENLVE